LNAVFEELFTPGGAEVVFRPSPDYGLAGKTLSFREIRRVVFEQGDIALGIREGAGASNRDKGTVSLNPDFDSRWTVGPGDRIIVLTTY
jgi:hypothetical protein